MPAHEQGAGRGFTQARENDLTLEADVTKDRGMPTWGVLDDSGNCVAMITNVGRGAWAVEDYSDDVTAYFRTKVQAFYYATSVIG